MTTRPIKVMIVDDHPIVRDALRTVLSALPEFALVATAATGFDAIEAAAVHHPDVVVMDLRMPGMDGVQTTRQLRAAHPDVAVLVLTMYDDEELLRSALEAGACGCLLKGVTHSEIVQALRAIIASCAVLGTDPEQAPPLGERDS